MSVSRTGYGPCPKCGQNVGSGGHGYTWRERSMDGRTHCGGCGYTGPSTEWPAKFERVDEPPTCEPGCELCRKWAERGAHEIVICSAVLAADGRVFRCHRHRDGLRTLEAAGVAYGAHEQAQGFVTSRNRYVDRYEAMRIQRAAGIESAAPGGYRGKQLFSEDLY